MSILSLILMIVFMIVCVLIILMVAIQDEKEQGLSGVFGGKQGSTFGAQTANVVVKFTAVLAAIFFCLALGLSLLNKRTNTATDSTIERYNQTKAVQSSQSAESTQSTQDAQGSSDAESSSAVSSESSPSSSQTN